MAQALLWTLPFWIVPAFVLLMAVSAVLMFVARLVWFSIEEMFR